MAADIRGHITDGCIVYSLVAGVMLPRLQQLLEHTDIVKPHFTWPKDCSDREWCHQCEITATFADLSMVEKTCPLSTNKDGEYIGVALLRILIAVFQRSNARLAIEGEWVCIILLPFRRLGNFLPISLILVQ